MATKNAQGLEGFLEEPVRGNPSLNDYAGGIFEKLLGYARKLPGDIRTDLANRLTNGKYEALMKENETLREQVETDVLTGLYNKRKLNGDLEKQISKYCRDGTPFSLAFFDIDYFKKLNDTYGHEIGDEVLKAFGEVCRQNKRGSDEVYRYGGEEFCVLFPDTYWEEAVTAAGRLRKVLSEYSQEGLPSFTVSGGVASYEKGDESPGNLLKRADRRLYEAKEYGRDRLCPSPE